jgi:hypothetical protein
VVFERIEGGKIRATTSSWDDAKVLLSTVADALEAAADVAASGWEAAAAVYRGARASSARLHGRRDHAHELLVGARTWQGFIAFSELACAAA